MKKIFSVIIIVFLYSKVFAIDAKIVTTIDYSLGDKWYLTGSETVPVIPTINKVFREQYFIFTFFISDYIPDGSGTAKAVCDIDVADPNGKLCFNKKGIVCLDSKIANSSLVMKSNLDLMINFENDKPIGDYTINITVYDTVSGKSKKTSQRITVSEFRYMNFFKSDQQFSRWMENYYQSPDPGNAIDAYIYFSKSKLNEKDSSFFPVFSFFLEIFRSNKYLVPYVVSMYGSQDFKTKIYLIYLLRYLEYDSGNFFRGLSGDEKKIYDSIRDKRYAPDPYDEIVNAAQLDILWGEFIATGRFKPVRRLVDLLEMKKYKGSLDGFKSIKNPTDKEKSDAYKGAIYSAVEWSIKSNCEQHQLVKSYCNYILKYDKKLGEEKREILKGIISGK